MVEVQSGSVVNEVYEFVGCTYLARSAQFGIQGQICAISSVYTSSHDTTGGTYREFKGDIFSTISHFCSKMVNGNIHWLRMNDHH